MTTCAVASPGDERFIVAELLSLSASVDAWNVTTSPVFQFAALSVIEEADGVTVAVPWKNSTETTTSSLGCCDRRTVKLPTPPSFTVSFDGEATIVCGTTVTVTVAWSQFVGLAGSQMLYTRVCFPPGVPAATSTEPSVASSVTPVFVDETRDRTTFVVVDCAPLKRSFASTLATAVPPAVEVTLPASLTASITNGTTVIATAA